MTKAFTIVSLLLLTACATSQKVNSISVGMTKAQVIEIMGQPDSSSAEAGVESLNYALYESAGERRFGRTKPYYVRLSGGKVEAYGRLGDFKSTTPATGPHASN